VCFFSPLTWIWTSDGDSAIVAVREGGKEEDGGGEENDLEGFVSYDRWPRNWLRSMMIAVLTYFREALLRFLTHCLCIPLFHEMGNEESTSNDGLFSPLERSHALGARDLRSVAKYMNSDECKNVYVMVRSISPMHVHDA